MGIQVAFEFDMAMHDIVSIKIISLLRSLNFIFYTRLQKFHPSGVCASNSFIDSIAVESIFNNRIKGGSQNRTPSVIPAGFKRESCLNGSGFPIKTFGNDNLFSFWNNHKVPSNISRPWGWYFKSRQGWHLFRNDLKTGYKPRQG